MLFWDTANKQATGVTIFICKALHCRPEKHCTSSERELALSSYGQSDKWSKSVKPDHYLINYFVSGKTKHYGKFYFKMELNNWKSFNNQIYDKPDK